MKSLTWVQLLAGKQPDNLGPATFVKILITWVQLLLTGKQPDDLGPAILTGENPDNFDPATSNW